MPQSQVSTDATARAIATVSKALKDLEPGPERFRAMAPGEFPVDWEKQPPHARCSKLYVVRNAVRSYLQSVLHQMAQVLIVDDQGGVACLFGLDTGTYDPEEAFGG